jgi:hypothetical protein
MNPETKKTADKMLADSLTPGYRASHKLFCEMDGSRQVLAAGEVRGNRR